MFEGIGFWEALQLQMVIPWGLGWFRHVLSYPLLGAFTVRFAILRLDVSFATAGSSRHLAFPLTWTNLACLQG